MEAGPTTSGYALNLTGELMRMQLPGPFLPTIKSEAIKSELDINANLEQENKGIVLKSQL